MGKRILWQYRRIPEEKIHQLVKRYGYSFFMATENITDKEGRDCIYWNLMTFSHNGRFEVIKYGRAYSLEKLAFEYDKILKYLLFDSDFKKFYKPTETYTIHPTIFHDTGDVVLRKKLRDKELKKYAEMGHTDFLDSKKIIITPGTVGRPKGAKDTKKRKQRPKGFKFGPRNYDPPPGVKWGRPYSKNKNDKNDKKD